jgi:hypothetical protein
MVLWTVNNVSEVLSTPMLLMQPHLLEDRDSRKDSKLSLIMWTLLSGSASQFVAHTCSGTVSVTFIPVGTIPI